MNFRKHMLNEMFSNTKQFTNDAELLRMAIVAELDAINFYEQLAVKATDSRVKRVLRDIAHEEKVHFGEFEELLELLDKNHEKAEDEAEEELKAMKILPTENE